MSPISNLLANYRAAVEAGHITEEYANRGMYQALAPVIANYIGHARMGDTRTIAQLALLHERVAAMRLRSRKENDEYIATMALFGHKIISNER